MSIIGKKNNTRQRPTPKRNSKKPPSFTHYYGSGNASETIARKKDSSRKPLSRIAVQQHAHALPTYIAIVFIVVSILYASFIGSSVSVLIPDGKGLKEDSYYQDQVTKVLANSPFNRSKFTFDTKSFADNIKKAIPEVEDAAVSIPLAGREPVVGLTFVTPLYIFTVSGSDYIVGTNGVILAEANSIAEDKKNNLTRLVDTAPLQIGVGKTVLLSTDVAFIESMKSELTLLSITVETMELPRGAGELYVKPAGQAYKIRFSLSGDAKQQVGSYAAVTKNIVDAPPQEYIDVRLGERVFVK